MLNLTPRYVKLVPRLPSRDSFPNHLDIQFLQVLYGLLTGTLQVVESIPTNVHAGPYRSYGSSPQGVPPSGPRKRRQSFTVVLRDIVAPQESGLSSLPASDKASSQP